MTAHTILAIDEEKETWDRIAARLEKRGFDIQIAESVDEAFRKLEELSIDLILLDESISGVHYLDIIRDIKAQHTIPLFVLSRHPDPPDKLVSIELGAEDFLCKPIDIAELAARIKSQLQLIADIKSELLDAQNDSDIRGLKFSQWILDFDRHELRHVEDGPVDLTSGELDILKTLAMSAGKVLSREQLFNATRGRNSDSFDRAVDVQISRIRQKLNHNESDIELIRTVRGVGYMLDTRTEEIT